MQPFTRPLDYSDAETFRLEEDSIFRGMWQFVAFSHELQNENDYVTREIGGKPVFVQRLDGELRAFENVCSHRFSQLHEGCGNRRLQCRYHGWIYGADGCPTAIPYRPRFDDLTQDTVRDLALTRWEIDLCGGLVFVRESADGPSLRDFLGDFFSELEQMTLALGPLLDRNEMVIDANWKIIVENTLETYHVDFVHTESFKRLGTTMGEFRFDERHSQYTSPLSRQVDAEWQRFLKPFAGRPVSLDGYLHLLVFPNLTLASTYGTSYSLQHIEPLGPDQTRFTSYVFQTALEEQSGVHAAMVETINHSVVEFNRQVFDEDRGICEMVHRGAKQARGAGLLSDEEARVADFQEHWLSAVRSTVEPQLLPITPAAESTPPETESPVRLRLYRGDSDEPDTLPQRTDRAA